MLVASHDALANSICARQFPDVFKHFKAELAIFRASLFAELALMWDWSILERSLRIAWKLLSRLFGI